MFDLWPASFFEWWSGQPWTTRYGVAGIFLLLSAVAYFFFGAIWFWGWGIGAVLLLFAVLEFRQSR